jgi:quercetin dioxygenase-like cupin family protein
MPMKNVVGLGDAVVKHEFVYTRNGVTTFECREVISREANGAENICVFKCVFGPREEHAKHKHTVCDEIVHCISGRGVEGIEVSPGKFEEFE